jgi:hypothetical protein
MIDFIAKINVRQLIIHFAGCWFFVYAFYVLAPLLDYKFLFSGNTDQGNWARIKDDDRMLTEFAFVGLAIAFVIMILIGRKWKWGIANPIIVFLVTFILKYYGFLGWSTLRKIFLVPGSFFNANSIPCICINAGFMLLFGSYLFFLKDVQLFINKGAKNYESAIVHKSAK